MAKHPLTIKQLEITADDITYEVLTMIQAYDLYMYGGNRSSRSQYAQAYQAMANCALESFLLHYRGLKEFLSDTHKKNSDDIKAVGYLWPLFTGDEIPAKTNQRFPWNV